MADEEEDSEEECKGLSAQRSRRLKLVRLKLQGVETVLGMTDAGFEPGLPPGWAMQHEQGKKNDSATFLSPGGERFRKLADALGSLPANQVPAPGVGSSITVWYMEGKKRSEDPVPYTGKVVQRTDGGTSSRGSFQVLFDEGEADWVDCLEDEWAWGKHTGSRPIPYSSMATEDTTEEAPKPRARPPPKKSPSARPEAAGGSSGGDAANGLPAEHALGGLPPKARAAAAANVAAAAAAAAGAAAAAASRKRPSDGGAPGRPAGEGSKEAGQGAKRPRVPQRVLQSQQAELSAARPLVRKPARPLIRPAPCGCHPAAPQASPAPRHPRGTPRGQRLSRSAALPHPPPSTLHHPSLSSSPPRPRPPPSPNPDL
jgi:hypothetical protein